MCKSSLHGATERSWVLQVLVLLVLGLLVLAL